LPEADVLRREAVRGQETEGLRKKKSRASSKSKRLLNLPTFERVGRKKDKQLFKKGPGVSESKEMKADKEKGAYVELQGISQKISNRPWNGEHSPAKKKGQGFWQFEFGRKRGLKSGGTGSGMYYEALGAWWDEYTRKGTSDGECKKNWSREGARYGHKGREERTAPRIQHREKKKTIH